MQGEPLTSRNGFVQAVYIWQVTPRDRYPQAATVSYVTLENDVQCIVKERVNRLKCMALPLRLKKQTTINFCIGA